LEQSLTYTLEPVNLVQAAYLSVALLGIAIININPRISSLRLLLAVVALLMVFNLLEETGISRGVHLITPIFTLGLGPAFYWFCRQLVYGETPNRYRVFLHWAPMLIAFPFTHWPQVIIGLGTFSVLVYLACSINLIRRYHHVATQASSATAETAIHWLTCFLIAFTLTMLQDLIRINVQPFASLPVLKSWYFTNTFIFFLLTSYLITKAVRQPQLFNDFKEYESLDLNSPPESIDEDASSLFVDIDKLVRSRDLYKLPRLSLRDLANETGLQEKTLSWIINTGAQRNFSEYVNGLRIEALCTALQEHPGTLLDLAYASGFSSKSSFNMAFKKEKGMTPTEYCKKIVVTPLVSGAES
jgi:AraC-like DNA-binding protein